MSYKKRKNPNIHRPQTSFEKRFGVLSEQAPFTHLHDATRLVLEDARRAGIDPEATEFGGATPPRTTSRQENLAAINGLRKKLAANDADRGINPFAPLDEGRYQQFASAATPRFDTPQAQLRAYANQVVPPQNPDEF